jgi:hypothetical protein
MQWAEPSVPLDAERTAFNPLNLRIGGLEYIKHADGCRHLGEGESAAGAAMRRQNVMPRKHPKDLLEVSHRNLNRVGNVLCRRRRVIPTGRQEQHGSKRIFGRL